MRKVVLGAVVVSISASGSWVAVRAQQQGGLSAAEKTRRWDIENELQSLATVERKVMSSRNAARS